MVFVLGAHVIMGLCAIKWCNSLMANIVKSKEYTTVENIWYTLGDSKIDFSWALWKGNRLLVFFFDPCPQNHGQRRNIHICGSAEGIKWCSFKTLSHWRVYIDCRKTTETQVSDSSVTSIVIKPVGRCLMLTPVCFAARCLSSVATSEVATMTA